MASKNLHPSRRKKNGLHKTFSFWHSRSILTVKTQYIMWGAAWIDDTCSITLRLAIHCFFIHIYSQSQSKVFKKIENKLLGNFVPQTLCQHLVPKTLCQKACGTVAGPAGHWHKVYKKTGRHIYMQRWTNVFYPPWAKSTDSSLQIQLKPGRLYTCKTTF